MHFYKTNMKYLIILFTLLCSLTISAQDIIEPCKFGQPLIDALQSQFRPSNPLGYGPARDILYSEIDNEGLNLSGIYTGFTVELDPNADPSVSAFQNGAGINAEHVYPQSQGAGDEPMKSDLHNIFPSKVSVNSDRGSCPFGEIEDTDTEKWYYLSSQMSSIPTSDIEKYSEKDEEDCVFEPREAVKGDIARAVFYFYAIYQDQALAASNTFFANQKDILYQWHLNDPVDNIESTRDELIAQEQGNNNPFIIDSTLAWRAFFEADASYPVGDPNCFSLTTSTDELAQQNAIRISSNLLEEVLTVFSENENGQVRLFDASGKMILEKKMLTETYLDVQALKQGIYILHVLTDEQRKVFKLFKN